MAKKSMIARERKRAKTVQRFAKKRAELKKIIASQSSSDEERGVRFGGSCRELPRNASPSRLRNRCSITGRPHGYYRKFGLARNKLREETMDGNVPGLRKASW